MHAGLHACAHVCKSGILFALVYEHGWCQYQYVPDGHPICGQLRQWVCPSDCIYGCPPVGMTAAVGAHDMFLTVSVHLPMYMHATLHLIMNVCARQCMVICIRMQQCMYACMNECMHACSVVRLSYIAVVSRYVGILALHVCNCRNKQVHACVSTHMADCVCGD